MLEWFKRKRESIRNGPQTHTPPYTNRHNETCTIMAAQFMYYENVIKIMNKNVLEMSL